MNHFETPPKRVPTLCGTSVATYLVIRSVGFCMPSISAILSKPICTRFCTYWNLSSRCLVFLPVPQRVAIDLWAVEPVWANTLTFFANLASSNVDLKNSASDTPWPIAYNSDSPDDKASAPLSPRSAHHVAPKDIHSGSDNW